MKITKYYCDMCGQEISIGCHTLNIFIVPLITINKFGGGMFKRKYDICRDCKYEIGDIIEAKRREREDGVN